MLETINKIVWGNLLLFLLLGTGLLLSIKFRFFQIFKIRYIFKNTILTLFNKQYKSNTSDKESISQFQTFATALAATMGTGNIVGVATALTIGGAGAIFWMWIS
ncbi:MAG: alanine:cation symporter family protein, partial [Oscillospiraceae bacterium]|nr:alanine:cation symporter family protein [Oscillospiraceae bacterium]